MPQNNNQLLLGEIRSELAVPGWLSLEWNVGKQNVPEAQTLQSTDEMVQALRIQQAQLHVKLNLQDCN